MAAAGKFAAAALQEDTPLKKHRLVLFSVSDSKDAVSKFRVSDFLKGV